MTTTLSVPTALRMSGGLALRRLTGSCRMLRRCMLCMLSRLVLRARRCPRSRVNRMLPGVIRMLSGVSGMVRRMVRMLPAVRRMIPMLSGIRRMLLDVGRVVGVSLG